jgi:hypothetical protein
MRFSCDSSQRRRHTVLKMVQRADCVDAIASELLAVDIDSPGDLRHLV